MEVVSLSENTVVVLFDQIISKPIAGQISQLKALLEEELSIFIIDMIPSYASIHLSFDLRKISHQHFIKKIESVIEQVTQQVKRTKSDENPQKCIEIPVYYAEEVGFDLKEISKTSGLSVEQVIQKHSDKIYDVYALGFSPGFAYLGKVDELIATSRKETPRLNIPQGSLGIADEQTALYPFESPGGWNIIGRTPINLVDYTQQPPCIMEVGDSIKFNPINQSEFLALGGVL